MSDDVARRGVTASGMLAWWCVREMGARSRRLPRVTARDVPERRRRVKMGRTLHDRIVLRAAALRTAVVPAAASDMRVGCRARAEEDVQEVEDDTRETGPGVSACAPGPSVWRPADPSG